VGVGGQAPAQPLMESEKVMVYLVTLEDGRIFKQIEKISSQNSIAPIS